jgi:hypothetical protein
MANYNPTNDTTFESGARIGVNIFPVFFEWDVHLGIYLNKFNELNFTYAHKRASYSVHLEDYNTMRNYYNPLGGPIIRIGVKHYRLSSKAKSFRRKKPYIMFEAVFKKLSNENVIEYVGDGNYDLIQSSLTSLRYGLNFKFGKVSYSKPNSKGFFEWNMGIGILGGSIEKYTFMEGYAIGSYDYVLNKPVSITTNYTPVSLTFSFNLILGIDFSRK